MQDHPLTTHIATAPYDPATWKTYWQENNQPWRSEPQLDEERQRQLLDYAQRGVDIEHAIYPFKDVKLSRADVEWLIAMHEQSEYAQQTGENGKQALPIGLDVRGADLSAVDLSALPLAGLRAGLSLDESRHATIEQSKAAAANLTRADLSYAQVQRAHLSWVLLHETVLVETHLEGADLGKASLKQAILAGTHLEGADLTKAHMEGATLLEAHLEGASLRGAFLESANLFEAHLAGVGLMEAHLEGANLLSTHCEGKTLSKEEHQRLCTWMPRFPASLPAADLRGAFLNTHTRLDGIHAGDEQHGYIALADVHWGDVNLTVLDWSKLKRLGDETLTLPPSLVEEETEPTGERGLPAPVERAIDKMLRAQEVSDVVVNYVLRSPALMGKLQERIVQRKKTPPETQKQRQRERFLIAVRANRQLAVVLRTQGLNEAADRFAYRASVLQRRVLRQSGIRSYGSYLFSWFLDILAGYGYKPGRTLIAYLSTILCFALLYYVLGLTTAEHLAHPLLSAIVISLIAFHGRGFLPGGFLPTLPMALCAACEAVIGLTIELSFIATFTQRYFGR
jgi:uncharacterized protein YjbI with pentapeptide repeats